VSAKQDRQGARTATDIERKYNFGKTFAELLGLINDARESVDATGSALSSEIERQVTSLTRNTEEIIMGALTEYVKETELEEVRKTVSSQLKQTSEAISLEFEKTTEELTKVNGDLQSVAETLEKHFDFTVDGLTIMAGGGSMNLLLDNDIIRFVKNGQEFGWWDGVDFHTGNIVVSLNERAQFGDFAFIPRSNGSLDFLKVGG
jgi:hypothetical protein